ncbi:hypothetical protein [Methylobacterium sp. J-076]|uniref:hypothetical protein n=1 Tax=Methylobacterium sp. J-076 TaxID=2836655 RepID=UPI001FBA7389|nr:hypothetical protein [Methylobacterium sp. J-076]MCJ2013865.1 hypothetical protein [Methylobacterium sp. J-076]
MRFYIDRDSGDAIQGWIVPDNPLAISRVVVSAGGRRIADVPASLIDENFKQFGWHSTGQCTFFLTEAEVPGLAGLGDLELYDADTNVRIYRRRPDEGLVQQRVLLINTGIEPETALQTALYPHFRHAYFGLHRLTDEILTSVLGSQVMPSLLLSGALIVPRYENYMMPDMMLTSIIVQDPYDEMATRMLWLRDRAAEAADPARRWRLGALAEAAAFAADYDLTDLRSLKRYFRMLPEAAYRLLYNPLIRQLATRMPEDRLFPGHSIAAIEVIARVGIVGHRERFDAFASSLIDRLGLDIPVPAATALPAETAALAERLRTVKAVQEMLIYDVALTDAVKDTVDKIWKA